MVLIRSYQIKEIDPTTDKKHTGTSTNFNPAMHMHVYPFAGKRQKIDDECIEIVISYGEEVV